MPTGFPADLPFSPNLNRSTACGELIFVAGGGVQKSDGQEGHGNLAAELVDLKKRKHCNQNQIDEEVDRQTNGQERKTEEERTKKNAYCDRQGAVHWCWK